MTDQEMKNAELQYEKDCAESEAFHNLVFECEDEIRADDTEFADYLYLDRFVNRMKDFARLCPDDDTEFGKLVRAQLNYEITEAAKAMAERRSGPISRSDRMQEILREGLRESRRAQFQKGQAKGETTCSP